MLQANAVRYFHHSLTLGFGIVILAPIPEAYRIKAKVVVQVILIQVRGDNHLKIPAPQFLCGLHADGVAGLRIPLAGLEALVAMPCDIAIVFAKLLFGEDHLL